MEITTSNQDPSLIDEQGNILTPDSKRFTCPTCQDFGEVLVYGVDPDGFGRGLAPCPKCGVPDDDDEEIPY